MGLYSQKCVKYLASIKTIVNGIQKPDGFEISSIEKGEVSEGDKERIEGAINACVYFPNLSLDEHRCYLFEEVHQTKIDKTSKGGIWGARGFNLSQWLNYNDPTTEYSTKAAAELLKGSLFE